MDDNIENLVTNAMDSRINDLEKGIANNIELQKFLYEKNYDELNLCRDWAIKVSAFTSALYLGIIALVTTDIGGKIVNGDYRPVIFITLTVFTILGCVNVYLRHKSYIQYRNIQVKYQNKWGVDTWNIYPDEWKNELNGKPYKTNASGYLFYEGYLIVTFLITLFIIINVPKENSADLRRKGEIGRQDSLMKQTIINYLDSNKIINLNLDSVIIKR